MYIQYVVYLSICNNVIINISAIINYILNNCLFTNRFFLFSLSFSFFLSFMQNTQKTKLICGLLTDIKSTDLVT